jgi:hypothetical protein
MLRIQRAHGLPPLDAPPKHLSAGAVQAWHDILAASPIRDSFCFADEPLLGMCASELALTRAGKRSDLESLRELYRQLGMLFVPMRDRRRLLFPDRAPRQ